MEVVRRLLLLGVLLVRTKTQAVQLEVVPSSFVSCQLSDVLLYVWVHKVLAEGGLRQLWSSKLSFLVAWTLEVPTLSVVLEQERVLIEELVLVVLVLRGNGLAS